MCADGHALFFEQVAGDASRKDERRGQPSGKMPAAPWVVVSTVFHIPCVIRMTGAHARRDVPVIVRARVRVFDHCAQRCARCASVAHAGEYANGVRFLSRGCGRVVARCAARHLPCDGFLIHRRACGQAIDDDADCRAVGFAENRQLEMFAKVRPHRACPPSDANSFQNAGADFAVASASVNVSSPSAIAEATAIAITMR